MTTRERWKKTLEHLVVGLVVLGSTLWAPSCIAGSWVVSTGVEQMLEWAEPTDTMETAQEPAGITERLRGTLRSGVRAVHEAGYEATRFTLTALGRFLVWALVFVGMIAWGALELRSAIINFFYALAVSTGDLARYARRGITRRFR